MGCSKCLRIKHRFSQWSSVLLPFVWGPAEDGAHSFGHMYFMSSYSHLIQRPLLLPGCPTHPSAIFLLWSPGSTRIIALTVWLSWLGSIQQSKDHWFKVRAHAWFAGSVLDQDTRQRQSIDVSLSHLCFSPSVSPFPSLTVIFFKKLFIYYF